MTVDCEAALTASEILDVRADNPFLLFPEGCDVGKRFRQLAKVWHPDLNAAPEAAAVLAHISEIREAVEGGGAVRTPVQERVYRRADGPAIRYRYRRVRTGEAGDVLIGSRTVAYELPADFSDLADAEVSMIASLRFADADMRRQMENFLPSIERMFSTPDSHVTILARPQDCVLLSDLIDHFGGRIPSVHVAWIVSSLLNICCYLDWMKISHGAISPNTVLVCPERHTAVLVGGWGFATRFGGKPLAVTERTLSKVPALAVDGAVADGKTDLKLVRALARDALGSSAGLLKDKDVPATLAQWLLLPPQGDAPSDYESWGRCLTETWGPRRFVKMDGADPRRIYATR